MIILNDILLIIAFMSPVLSLFGLILCLGLGARLRHYYGEGSPWTNKEAKIAVYLCAGGLVASLASWCILIIMALFRIYTGELK